MPSFTERPLEYVLIKYSFYTLIPPDISTTVTARTFCVLPKSAAAANHFVPARNTLAEDEIHAHTGMFEPSTNDGYYQLGLAVAGFIREALMRTRGQFESKEKNAEKIAEQGEEFAAPEPDVRGSSEGTGAGTQPTVPAGTSSSVPAEENPWV